MDWLTEWQENKSEQNEQLILQVKYSLRVCQQVTAN